MTGSLQVYNNLVLFESPSFSVTFFAYSIEFTYVRKFFLTKFDNFTCLEPQAFSKTSVGYLFMQQVYTVALTHSVDPLNQFSGLMRIVINLLSDDETVQAFLKTTDNFENNLLPSQYSMST